MHVTAARIHSKYKLSLLLLIGKEMHQYWWNYAKVQIKI